MAKAKKAGKTVKKAIAGLKSVVTKPSVDVRKHLESAAKTSKDAAMIWEIIKDDKHTDDDIRVIVKSFKFDTLLGEIS